MSNKTSASGDSCSTTSCCAWKFAVALLLLRMCIGWHFFSEGTKKISYDEGRQQWQINVPTEMLFRNATGPLAGVFKNQVPGFYNWENLLAAPHQSQPLDSKTLNEQKAWQSDYAFRRKRAAADKQPVPIEFPEYATYKAWGDKIVEGLREKQKKFTALSGIKEEQAAESAELLVARHQQLADFFEEETQAIQDYQHELWRLDTMQAEPDANEVPFRQERLAAKQAEVKGMGNRIVSDVRGIEQGFNDDLRGILIAEQRADAELSSQLESALTNPKARRLELLNVAVTSLIIGVGACLLLGLFTRLAAFGGMMFLLSVMITQLPWVPGADTKFFYYQLVEFMALLALLASGPWRLPSLDGLLRGLCTKCCGAKR